MFPRIWVGGHQYHEFCLVFFWLFRLRIICTTPIIYISTCLLAVSSQFHEYFVGDLQQQERERMEIELEFVGFNGGGHDLKIRDLLSETDEKKIRSL